jgi:hypothetical protein
MELFQRWRSCFRADGAVSELAGMFFHSHRVVLKLAGLFLHSHRAVLKLVGLMLQRMWSCSRAGGAGVPELVTLFQNFWSFLKLFRQLSRNCFKAVGLFQRWRSDVPKRTELF